MKEVHENPQNLVGKSENSAMSDNNKQEPVRNFKGEVNPKDPQTWGKVARNDLCPCGSGKKFKHCHGKFD